MKRLRAALDFLFAPRANCQGCGSELGSDRGWLCAECYANLKPLYLTALVREELCVTCGGVIRGAGRCEACGERRHAPFSAAAAYAYEAPVILIRHCILILTQKIKKRSNTLINIRKQENRH